MKISLEQAENSELEVIIKGDIQSEEALALVSVLGNASAFGKILLQGEDESILCNPKDIIFFESSAGKTYASTQNGTYEVKEKLYELSDSLKNKGFIQINKSTVVNINFVQSISAEFSGNYIAKLKNSGDTLVISRKYFNSFKEFVRR